MDPYFHEVFWIEVKTFCASFWSYMCNDINSVWSLNLVQYRKNFYFRIYISWFFKSLPVVRISAGLLLRVCHNFRRKVYRNGFDSRGSIFFCCWLVSSFISQWCFVNMCPGIMCTVIIKLVGGGGGGIDSKIVRRAPVLIQLIIKLFNKQSLSRCSTCSVSFLPLVFSLNIGPIWS
jgi:hypothetical protein